MILRLTVCAAILAAIPGCVPDPEPGGSPTPTRSPAAIVVTANDNTFAANMITEQAIPQVDVTPASPKMELYIRAATASLDSRVRDMLERIADPGRQLLALRSYLRSDRVISERWAWTAEDAQKFESTSEHASMMSEVDKVRRSFAEANAGYTLRVNTDVRTLDEQLRNWLTTSSVTSASRSMLDAAERELANPSYAAEPEPADVENFRRYVRSFVPSPQPTVAAPGLSPHGQLRAFDFVIEKDGEIVAGARSADAKSVWDEAGWTKKLNQAVLRSTNKLSGPLMNPYEPWHYTYHP